MKLLLLKDKLKEGLDVTKRACTKSLSLPILENILLSTEKNFLKLTSTDLEIAINWWSLAKVEKEGKIVVPSHVFYNFVNLLPSKKVSLEKKDLTLNVQCENYNTQIKGLNPEDFPIIPHIKEAEKISLENRLFCQGLEQVVGIASPSTTRPEISGVYLIFEKNFVKMVATDSFRLAEKTFYYKAPSNLQHQYKLIIPQKAARELVNIFGGGLGEGLNIYLSPNQICFEQIMPESAPHPHIQFLSRLIEGEYPDYQEIIPKKYETQIIIQKNEFLNQVKTASLFSGKINEIKLKVSPKKKRVIVFSQSPDLGEYQSFFPAKITGKEIEISFNYRFLIDGLLNIKSPEVVFELTGVEGPGMLKPLGDETYFYIVMPIKSS